MKRVLATWILICSACDEPPATETPPDADVPLPPDAGEVIDVVEIDAFPVILPDAGPCGECDYPGYCLDGTCHDAIWMSNEIGEWIVLKLDGEPKPLEYQGAGAGAIFYRRNPTSTTPVPIPVASDSG